MTGPERFRALGHLPPGQMNRTEAEHAANLNLLLKAGEVIWYGFEVLKLYIGPDCWYRPDFLVQLADRTLEIHEVKGSFITDDAKVKLKAAANLYPQFRFVLWQKSRNLGWQQKIIA